MTNKKKEFILRTIKANNYNGPIAGFSECIKCGGECCKKNACACVPDDFQDLTLQGIKEILATGNYMITASYRREERDGIPVTAYPYISAREVDAPQNGIHITMMHSKCAMLRADGCKLTQDDRPSQGLLLIPNGHRGCTCFVDTPTQLWLPYKDVLDRVVSEYTGKTTQELFEKELFPLANKIKRSVQMAVIYDEPVTVQEILTASAMASLGVFYGLFGEEIGKTMDDFIKIAPIKEN